MVDSTPYTGAQPQDGQELTDDQIQKLLLEAEGRLRGLDTQNTDANALR